MTNLIKLRPYQIEAIESIKRDFSKGHKKVLLVAPTGSGKTVIFNSLVKDLGVRTLVIAHRRELLYQSIDKYVLIGGKKEDCGVIEQGRFEIKPYTVASVQSLYSKLNILDGKNWDLVIVDEAHHTLAPTYLEVLKRLEKTNPEIKVLGATATPFRGDDKELLEYYEKISYSIDIYNLIKWGYLVPFRGKRVILEEIDLDKVSLTKEGDLSLKGLSKLFENEKTIEKVVEKWLEETGGERKTIFFCPSIEVSKLVRNALLRRGIAGEHIDGKLSIEERERILRDFREGKLIALSNVNVLTEGFDDPSGEVIVNLRPTTSKVLYIQIVGRALRPFFGKKDAYILDFTGVSKKYSLAGLHYILELSEKEKEAYLEGKLVEVLPKGDDVAVKVEGVEEKKTEIVEAGEEEFSFERVEIDKYITKFGHLYLLSCGLNRKLIVLEENGDGTYKLYVIYPYRFIKILEKRIPYDYAFAVMETIFKECRDRFMETYSEKAINLPPTEKQIKFLKRFGITDLEKQGINNRLQASNLIGLLKNLYPSAETGFKALVYLLIKWGLEDNKTYTLPVFFTQKEIERYNFHIVKFKALAKKKNLSEEYLTKAQKWIPVYLLELPTFQGEIINRMKNFLIQNKDFLIYPV